MQNEKRSGRGGKPGEREKESLQGESMRQIQPKQTKIYYQELGGGWEGKVLVDKDPDARLMNFRRSEGSTIVLQMTSTKGDEKYEKSF